MHLENKVKPDEAEGELPNKRERDGRSLVGIFHKLEVKFGPTRVTFFLASIHF